MVNEHTYESDTCVIDARATNHNVRSITLLIIITFVKHYVEELPNGEMAMVTHLESIRYFNEIEFEINNLM